MDAIIGARRHLHTVFERACTGCELCIVSCPVDCIVMRPRAAGDPAPAPADNRGRYEAQRARVERSAHERSALLAERKRIASTPGVARSQ